MDKDIKEDKEKHLIKLEMGTRSDEDEFIKVPFNTLINQLKYKFIDKGINIKF